MCYIAHFQSKTATKTVPSSGFEHILQLLHSCSIIPVEKHYFQPVQKFEFLGSFGITNLSHLAVSGKKYTATLNVLFTMIRVKMVDG